MCLQYWAVPVRSKYHTVLPNGDQVTSNQSLSHTQPPAGGRANIPARSGQPRVRLRRRQPPPTCRRVQSLTRGLFGSLLADHGKPIQARSASTHIDWCWHLADAAAFSRMGEHRHVTSSCGLGRSPHVFPLPCSATQMFWLILHWSWWRFGFSGPVSPLVAVWPDSEWIYGSVYLRSDCHLSGAVEPT